MNLVKKYCFLIFLMSVFATHIHGQEPDPQIFLGANAGIATTNDAQFVVGLDAELLALVDQNFKVGAATGLVFATENNGILLPLALSGRFRADAKFGLGLDFGYGIPINKSSGSLYFRPILDYKLSYKSKLRFSYAGLNNLGYVNIGIVFRLNPRRSIVIDW